MGLDGNIPGEVLGNLANLKVLKLYGNQLRGEIPPELGNLTALTVLHLYGNNLIGCVPSSLQEQSLDDKFGSLALGGLEFCR